MIDPVTRLGGLVTVEQRVVAYHVIRRALIHERSLKSFETIRSQSNLLVKGEHSIEIAGSAHLLNPLNIRAINCPR